MSVDQRSGYACHGRDTPGAIPAAVEDVAEPHVSPAEPGELAPAAASGKLAATRRWVTAYALFIVGVSAVVAMSLVGIPGHLAQDGWLALVTGRIIAQHGIPRYHDLTVMAHGVRWIDQQWLAQVVMYGLQQLGGLQLLTVSYVLITGLAFAMSLAAARALGGEGLDILTVLPLGAFLYLATAVSIRTQGLAYPFFVATVWLLAAEVRRPGGRRVYLVFPLLIVWANLHGSVTLGVGIAMIYGATILAGDVMRRGRRGLMNRRALLFVCATPLTLLATPYGTGVIHYYRATLFNSEFSKLVTEWKPATSVMLLAVPLLVIIGGAIWTLGRSGRRTPAFDQIVICVLAFAAVDAIRNITWFGLALVILLPSVIATTKPGGTRALRKSRVNFVLAVGSVAVALTTGTVVLAKPVSWFESQYPPRILASVEKALAHHPGAKIFADVQYADWLVWQDQALGSRIAYDTSFELLTDSQLSAIASLGQMSRRQSLAVIAPYRVLVLNPANKASNRILLSRSGVSVLMRSSKAIVATRSSS